MRSKNMQVLTEQIKAKRPGTTIWGVSDDAHKKRISGHNEDDTPGVRAEDQDADNIPEHRALDIPITEHFSHDNGNLLTHDLVTNEENQKRLLYVNWQNTQWSRKNNWQPIDNSNDFHDHVHVSGEADDDDNETPWVLSEWDPVPGSPEEPSEDPMTRLEVDGELGPKTIRRWQEIMGTPVDGVISPKNSALVRAVQEKLKATVDHRLVVDGEGIVQDGRRYKTVGALQRYLGSPVDQVMSKPKSQVVKALQRRLNEGRF